MHDKIQAILARELAKIDALSLSSPEPLSPADVRSLDTLIKAFRTLVAPDPDKPAGKTLAEVSTEELLKSLSDEKDSETV